MNAQPRFLFNLYQVSSWLNDQVEKKYHVGPSTVKQWADQDCFPVDKRGEDYRIRGEVLHIVEETRDLIITEGMEIESAKKELINRLNEKEAVLERKEKLAQLSLLESLDFEALKTQLIETANGQIIALTESEVAIKNHMENLINKSEERLKSSVIYSEVRMKQVMERVEKRINQHVTEIVKQASNGSLMSDDIQDMIQKHQEEMKALKKEYEEKLQEIKKEHDEKYNELLYAGFFKRLKMRKENKK